MNDQSLQESNAILKAAVSRAEVGEIIAASPGELAGEANIESRLAAARAIRALIARGRIAPDGDSYRLLDARPLGPGEPPTVQPTTRKPRRPRSGRPESDGVPTYEQVGRLVIERLIELSAETAELRVALERARTEAEAARREAVEVTRAASGDRRRAETLEDEVGTLKRRLDMTESNLRSVVQSARNRPASPLEDVDAKAILDILATKEDVE